MKARIHQNLRVVKYWYLKEILRKNVIITCLSSFLAISGIGFLSELFLESSDMFFLIGSFGASAVILFAMPKGPLSKPKSLFGGHLISAFIGVTVAKFIPDPIFAAALAVSLSIAIMKLTDTIHPPAGASALIAVIGSQKIKLLGYWYVFSTVLPGILVLYLVYLLFHKTKLKSKKKKKR